MKLAFGLLMKCGQLFLIRTKKFVFNLAVKYVVLTGQLLEI